MNLTGNIGDARRNAAGFRRAQSTWAVKAALELLAAATTVMTLDVVYQNPVAGERASYDVEFTHGSFVVRLVGQGNEHPDSWEWSNDEGRSFQTVRDAMRFMSRGGRFAPTLVDVLHEDEGGAETARATVFSTHTALNNRAAVAPAAATAIQAAVRGAAVRRRYAPFFRRNAALGIMPHRSRVAPFLPAVETRALENARAVQRAATRAVATENSASRSRNSPRAPYVWPAATATRSAASPTNRRRARPASRPA